MDIRNILLPSPAMFIHTENLLLDGKVCGKCLSVEKITRTDIYKSVYAVVARKNMFKFIDS